MIRDAGVLTIIDSGAVITQRLSPEYSDLRHNGYVRDSHGLNSRSCYRGLHSGGARGALGPAHSLSNHWMASQAKGHHGWHERLCSFRLLADVQPQRGHSEAGRGLRETRRALLTLVWAAALLRSWSSRRRITSLKGPT